jgi:hypothetical protein
VLTLYVFVRQDIPLAQQLVQSCHAVFQVSSKITYPPEIEPNMVLIGVPDEKALLKVQTKLNKHQIEHHTWSEPDFDFGFTAIATVPLTESEKLPLSTYRLWRY